MANPKITPSDDKTFDASLDFAKSFDSGGFEKTAKDLNNLGYKNDGVNDMKGIKDGTIGFVTDRQSDPRIKSMIKPDNTIDANDSNLLRVRGAITADAAKVSPHLEAAKAAGEKATQHVTGGADAAHPSGPDVKHTGKNRGIANGSQDHSH